ncbi:hypothetical protein J7T55_004463 [Diaporthe amygdali]|uniref:uncharacterized protein n=1 Tax=Phomopsis amygdali TaxID=1214568 RepID=UPI0022FDDDEF|nr:uncharacterized protein J7T55_004463 [Diaporthe amygdali]KAJ0109913.1 hypothetical protein J7T55_004463 [Diaporthe amygdali]
MNQYSILFEEIAPDRPYLQIISGVCSESGLDRVEGSVSALVQWLRGQEEHVTAVYLLPTSTDADIVMAHLSSNDELDPSIVSRRPSPAHVLITSCQDFLIDELVGEILAAENVVVVVNLDRGIVNSHMAAMATTIFSNLKPRDQTNMRMFALITLSHENLSKPGATQILDPELVYRAVRRGGWQVSQHTFTLKVERGQDSWSMRTKQKPGTEQFDRAQRANALNQLQEVFQRDTQKKEASSYKTVLLMSQGRFRRLVASITFVKVRASFIHGGTPATQVRRVLEDQQPGFVVIGISTEVGILPRIPGLRTVIADFYADRFDFDDAVGHSVAHEKDAFFIRTEQLLDVVNGSSDVNIVTLCLDKEVSPTMLRQIPAHHTGEMFHLIMRVAAICPELPLLHVPCLVLPDELPRFYERLRRLHMWGLVKLSGWNHNCMISLGGPRAQLMGELAQHETNIHSLNLLASAMYGGTKMSIKERRVLVWLAAIIAHGPSAVLVHPDKDTRYSEEKVGGGSVPPIGRRGEIWSAFLGMCYFYTNKTSAAKTPYAVDEAEAQQVLERIRWWLDSAQLTEPEEDSTDAGQLSHGEIALIDRELVRAFIYNICMYDKVTHRLVDLLSEKEIRLDSVARPNLEAHGGMTDEKVVFAVYTQLEKLSADYGARNLTVVSHDAVYTELLRIAPRASVRPGQSPIDLDILRPRTAPVLAPTAGEPLAPEADEPAGVSNDNFPVQKSRQFKLGYGDQLVIDNYYRYS